ncbi:FkbM family methyltransferase [Candidatus Ferrigenium straubiae]|uniref:FkbM family methyltransferase n=1 Tax=Candidatus Ferrigenium straubiae TaxID=2919506 RepID=UPI003F4ADFED
MKTAADLSGYKKNITSQFGEDGIIEEILNRIGIENAFCVEFGAWDGKHFSNTWQLWHDKAWSAVLIEGNPDKVVQLEKSLAEFKKVVACCAYVGLAGENTLDAILEKVGAPRIIDVLSIDIDGNDYHVFESINLFSARVVLVEFNPTIPPHVELVAAPGNYFGSSALSICKLAKAKNYSLAACTTANLIFVRNADFDKLGFDEPMLAEIMPTDCLTYVITAFDGTSYLSRRPPYKDLRKPSLWGLLKAYGRNLLGKKNDDFVVLKKQMDTITPVSIYSGF